MAPIVMQFRGVEFVKKYVIKYLRYIFSQYQKGKLIFTDGTNQIKFSNTPYVIAKASWDSRQKLPVVLVGSASGQFIERTFSENRIVDESNDDDGEFRYFGGDIDLTLELQVIASTAPERDSLVDILCIFLTHPGAKQYFLKHDIKLPEPPSIGGEEEISMPDIDYPLFGTTVSLNTHSGWLEWENLEDRLEDIIAYVDMETEFD